MYAVVNTIFYLIRAGCQWQLLTKSIAAGVGGACLLASLGGWSSAEGAGTVTLRIGSTSGALGSTKLLADAFMRSHPEIENEVLPSIGSGGGIRALRAGAIDIALSSRSRMAKEHSGDDGGIIEVGYAETPLTFATALQASVNNITPPEAAATYTQQIRTWPNGQPGQPILRPQSESDIPILRGLSKEMDRAPKAVETHHIDRILGRPRKLDNPVRFQVVGTDNLVMSEYTTDTSGNLALPIMQRTAELFDAGQVVGKMKVASSLRPLLVRAAIIGLICLGFVAAIFFVLCTLPLRALNRAWQDIAYLVSHDQLTDLPNRALFWDRLQQALAQAERQRHGVAVICLDLDRFKDVNDTLGHAVGDELLRQVTHRVQSLLRKSDMVARLGGDEFAIVLTALEQPDHAGGLAQGIIDALAEPFQLRGHDVIIGSSIGIALYPDDEGNPDHLLRNADLALYRAKAEGRGVYRFFEEDMNVRLQQRKALEADLRRALVEDQFEIYYQPQIGLDGEQVVGVEALIRWHHPERGMVAPMDFIPAAEEIGLIIPITEWVLRRACTEARDWDDFSVAINLSPVVFKHQDLIGLIEGVLSDTNFDPYRLELEITEMSLLRDSERALTILNDLKAMGIRIAIDDFGTGYSSLSYLQRFPFDKIKIDRSFVSELTVSDDAIAIVRAVINLGQSLGMATTAEGVESIDQAAFLTGQGCDEVQGFYYARPMPALEIGSIVEGPFTW